MSNYLSSTQQNTIIERALGCCEYCKSQMHYSGQPFEIDHIEPISRGGETALVKAPS